MMTHSESGMCVREIQKMRVCVSVYIACFEGKFDDVLIEMCQFFVHMIYNDNNKFAAKQFFDSIEIQSNQKHSLL